MSAFNAFFAQLTGGGAPGTPSAGGGGHAERGRGNPAAGGSVIGNAIGGAGGIGGGDGGGSDNSSGAGVGGSEVFGVPLNEANVTYYPESDRRRFGNPQVRVVFMGEG